MTLWIGYAKAGKEFEVQAEIEAMGITVHCARKIEAKRSGKNRRPEPIESPVLPNYLFIEVDTERWFELADVKHLAVTKTVVPSVSIPNVMSFMAAQRREYDQTSARIEAGERIEEFKDGDSLTILNGPLAGQMARFKRIVETDKYQFPLIEAEIELMGRVAKAQVDPLDVRAAE